MTKEYTNLILETMNDKFQQMLECFSVLDTRIDRFEERLTEKIELVDAKVMGLSKRVASVEKSLNEKIDTVEQNLSAEIVEVRDELRAHRENVELHAAPKKRVLKKVV
ncbi:hypothetical protein [Trichlorobacter lovleyi]|uniref:hypothetical protein n=1 Tax=Trichlorobacter lovleyi TaxID=313985 RepID=UPI003D0CBEF8